MSTPSPLSILSTLPNHGITEADLDAMSFETACDVFLALFSSIDSPTVASFANILREFVAERTKERQVPVFSPSVKDGEEKAHRVVFMRLVSQQLKTMGCGAASLDTEGDHATMRRNCLRSFAFLAGCKRKDKKKKEKKKEVIEAPRESAPPPTPPPPRPTPPPMRRRVVKRKPKPLSSRMGTHMDVSSSTYKPDFSALDVDLVDENKKLRSAHAVLNDCYSSCVDKHDGYSDHRRIIKLKTQIFQLTKQLEMASEAARRQDIAHRAALNCLSRVARIIEDGDPTAIMDMSDEIINVHAMEREAKSQCMTVADNLIYVPGLSESGQVDHHTTSPLHSQSSPLGASSASITSFATPSLCDSGVNVTALHEAEESVAALVDRLDELMPSIDRVEGLHDVHIVASGILSDLTRLSLFYPLSRHKREDKKARVSGRLRPMLLQLMSTYDQLKDDTSVDTLSSFLSEFRELAPQMVELSSRTSELDGVPL